MQFVTDTLDDDVIVLFGYRDAYNFLSSLLDGKLDGDQPVNVRLTVGDESGVIMAQGRPTAVAHSMMRRLWSRPEGERTWVHARKVAWHHTPRSLTVVF